MAKTRSKKGVPATLPSLACRHGTSAFGARYLREGFSFTPEHDLSFALGRGGALMSPETLFADADPAELAAVILPDAQRHRNVAVHYIREGFHDWEENVAAEPHPPDVTADEAAKLLALGHVDAPICPALEAMVGPDVVLNGLVSYLENVEADPPGRTSWDNNVLSGYFQVLAGLLLRVPKAEHAAARRRLEALCATRASRHGALRLDVLLHGKEGILRSGYKYDEAQDCYGHLPGVDAPPSSSDLILLNGEAEAICHWQEALWEQQGFRPRKWMLEPEMPRMFFLGGDARLELELRVVDSYPKTMHAAAFEAYREIRSPLVVRLMLRLGHAGSPVKKKVAAWFEEHATYTADVLEEIIADPDDDDAAAAQERKKAP
jgi:hypothetical protein